MPPPFLLPSELADLRKSALPALPEACTRRRAGVSDVVTTCAVLPGGGDTELGQPPLSVGALPRWRVRLPALTDVRRGDALLTLGGVYYVTDLPTPRTYTVFIEAQTISFSPLPLQAVTLRAAYIPGQAGTVICPCSDGHRTSDPSDPTCFGRGVVGGYAPASSLSLFLVSGMSETVQQPEGYLQQQRQAATVVIPAEISASPGLKRDDLLIVTPDPLGTPDNPDRRYVIGDMLEPVQIFGTVIGHVYEAWGAELGAIVYRVPPANLTALPDGVYGTL